MSLIWLNHSNFKIPLTTALQFEYQRGAKQCCSSILPSQRLPRDESANLSLSAQGPIKTGVWVQ